MVTCNVTASASNIHKALESLEVGPVVVEQSARCPVLGQSVRDVNTSSSQQPRRFSIVVNVTTNSPGGSTCLEAPPTITLDATTLSGNLVSTIDKRPPLYKFALPISPQGIVTLYAAFFIGLSRYA